jgi:hypothetical protein
MSAPDRRVACGCRGDANARRNLVLSLDRRRLLRQQGLQQRGRRPSLRTTHWLTWRTTLDRDRLAKRLAGILRAVARQTESAVVALIGPWGSGKTTLLHAVEKHVRAGNDWYLARYNPWSYTTLATAVEGFFAELKGALPQDALGSERRAALGKLGARIAPIGALGGVIGIDASDALREIARLVGGDQSPENIRAKAAQELESLDKPVLVLIDDLDRLEPAELLLTFKLVRLLGRLPHVYYLLSYDEATLESVLGRTELVGAERGRARDYLEKMVQVRLDVPPLLSRQRAVLVQQALDAVLARHSVELDETETVRLQQMWAHSLEPYMTQPRAVKKLFAQLDALWPEVAGEVNFVDFLGMTFLRTFERSAFDLVVDSRDELVGALSLSSTGRDKENLREQWQRWLGSLGDAGVRHPEAVAILLSEMFLPLRSARENMNYGSHYSEDIARRKGVGSDEFFDRYTQLGNPPGDISEALVARAIDELVEDTDGSAVTELEELLATDANPVVRKLSRLADAGALPAAPTLRLLGEHYLEAMEQKTGFMGLSADFGMTLLAVKLLDSLSEHEARTTIEGLCASVSGTALAADALQKIALAEEADQDHAWRQAALDLVRPAIESHVTAATSHSLSEADAALVHLLWVLRHVYGSDDVQAFLWPLLDQDNAWTLPDLLALLVPVGSASDGRSSWRSLGDFNAGSFDALLGVERVLNEIGDVPTIEFPESDFDRRRQPVTLDVRRTYALAVVSRLKREQEIKSQQAEDAKQSEGHDASPVKDD